jgi:hypothetical protein
MFNIIVRNTDFYLIFLPPVVKVLNYYVEKTGPPSNVDTLFSSLPRW